MAADAESFVKHTVRCNMALVGPKFGPLAPRIQEALTAMDAGEVVRAVGSKLPVEVTIDGETVALTPEEIEVATVGPERFVISRENDLTVALDTELTEELRLEGLARDVVRHVQQLRKEVELNMEDRIRLVCRTQSDDLSRAIATWREYICAETLCVELIDSPEPEALKTVKIGGEPLELWLERQEV